MKKLAVIMAGVLTTAALAVPAMAAEGDYTIVVNLKTLSSEYWQNVKSGIDQAAEELGITIDVQGAAAETEIAEQVQQLETQLAAAPGIYPRDRFFRSGRIRKALRGDRHAGLCGIRQQRDLCQQYQLGFEQYGHVAVRGL